VERSHLRSLFLCLLLVLGVQCCMPIQAEQGSVGVLMELTEGSVEVIETGVEPLTHSGPTLDPFEAPSAYSDQALLRHTLSYPVRIHRSLLPVAGLYPAAP